MMLQSINTKDIKTEIINNFNKNACAWQIMPENIAIGSDLAWW